jgi:ATP-dependent Lhr-like helicase
MGRRWLVEASASTFGQLDIAAIERVREEAWPEATSADEMHDALLGLAFITPAESARNAEWPGFLAELARQRRATRIMVRTPSVEIGCELWVAAERLPQLDAVFAQATRTPPIDAPEEFSRRPWTREAALVEITRSRLEALGPVTSTSIAASMCVPVADTDAALVALAAEGVAMAGAFTPLGPTQEWCDRALLARIHRYTVQRLRQEIEPVSTQDFMRFLFRWQHLMPNDRREGPDALDAVISQLQGFEAPVAAWETELLPARLDAYDMTWLDDLCLSGRAIWARLTPPGNGNGATTSHAGPIRTTPVALLPRRAAAAWHRVAPMTFARTPAVSARAQAVIDHLRVHGASFYDEIVEGSGLLRTQVEEALAELVAYGIATADSFAGLRALLTPSEKRRSFSGGRRHRRALSGIEEAGRWSLRRRDAPAATNTRDDLEAAAQSAEHVAHALLRRYGVVSWRMLQREAAWLPPWRDLLRVLRRLEARGEIRGGRFVASISGEQYALPEAVKMLRDTRRAPPTGEFVVVSGADPLNLVGTLLPGAKVPALTGNRVLYRDGEPVGALVAGELRWFAALDTAALRKAEDHLVTGRAAAVAA